MNKKIQVYLAGSMFCEADRMYNALLAEKIRERVGEHIDLYVPQENLSINDNSLALSLLISNLSIASIKPNTP